MNVVKLTQSLAQWVLDNRPDIFPFIMFGHTEMLTDEMWEQYIAWCQTDDGKQYLEGGSKYKEDW